MLIFTRLLTGGTTSAFSNTLRRHKNVWENNVDHSISFDSRIGFQLNKTLNQRNTAFYWIHDDVLNRKEFECKVDIEKKHHNRKINCIFQSPIKLKTKMQTLNTNQKVMSYQI